VAAQDKVSGSGQCLAVRRQIGYLRHIGFFSTVTLWIRLASYFNYSTQSTIRRNYELREAVVSKIYIDTQDEVLDDIAFSISRKPC
jgi:hypothetical protein